jgi:hypothetical protein
VLSLLVLVLVVRPWRLPDVDPVVGALAAAEA